LHAGYQRRLVRVATRSHNTNSDPDGSPPSKLYTLDEEIESWKGFPWALRKEDVEVWDRMIRGAREYEYAIKKSGRWLTTEPFFIAILFMQYKTIRSLEGEATNAVRASWTHRSGLSACKTPKLTYF